jgi:hypothetical protein
MLEPLIQGDCTGLCALYSTLNAIRLALADHMPLTRAQCTELFAAGIDHLHRKRNLNVAIIEGMGLRRRLSLAQHLVKLVSTTKCQVTVERADYADWSTIADIFGWIEQSLSVSRPVMIAFVGSLNHYSVVVRSAPGTLGLFDSSMRFVRKSSCGLRDGYHHIPPNGLLRVAVHRPG